MCHLKQPANLNILMESLRMSVYDIIFTEKDLFLFTFLQNLRYLKAKEHYRFDIKHLQN